MNLDSTQSLRQQYEMQALHEAEMLPDPVAQFGEWYAAAIRDHLPQYDAMTLATATPEGRPSARMVLLKGFDAQGFTFFTHYQSRKGQELARNPWAALVFWWYDQHRQVRIEGTVTPVPPQESDEYFRSRPRGSQIGAWASVQSEVLRGREPLQAQIVALEERFKGQEVLRPSAWGGFRLEPVQFEFWQGRDNRLHDRIIYELREDGTWAMGRLSP